ncbi:MAG: ABC transporter substrate-binding protein [Alphaproteobacteria bacterium]
MTHSDPAERRCSLRYCAPALGLWLLCALAMVLQTGAAVAGGTLRLGVQLEPPNLDPTSGAAAAIDEIVYANVFEGLTRIGPDGTVRPGLAEHWSVAADGLTYVFHLRADVRFHDGTAFDAQDVVFTLDRARAPDTSNAQKALFAPIVRVEAIDPLTVAVHLARPVGAFLTYLAWGDAVIVAPESADGNAVRPIGTGPFRFADWRKGATLRLTRFEAYWGSGPVGGPDAILFTFIPDPAAAFAALMAGDVDGFPSYPAPENIARFERDPRFRVEQGSSEGEVILAINNGAAPFDDIRVRRALAHAIDRKGVIDGAFFGFGAPIGSHFPPHHPSHVDLTGAYPFDPARARALLAEAGYPDGFAVTLTLPPPSYARRGGEAVAGYLTAAGLSVRIETMEWAQWLEQVFRNKDFQLTMVAHTEPLDIDIYARNDYYFQYKDERFNAVIARLSATADPAERDHLFKMAQRLLSEDAVNVFLAQLPKIGVWRRGIEGVWRNAPLQANDVTGVSLPPGGALGPSAATGPPVIGALLVLVLAAGAVGLGRFLLRAGTRVLLSRLAGLAITLAAASLVVFVLVEIVPGDPARFMMGLQADANSVAAVRAELGLDRPAPVRYLTWIAGLLQGDFGISYTYRVPVSDLIVERIGVSAPLALMALLLSTVLALPAGVWAASRQGRAEDAAVMGVAQAGLAIPNFWFALLLVLLFSVSLRWFSAGGFPGWDAGALPALKSLVLPAVALAVPQAAILARVMRTALIDTLGQDYMRTARAKGLSAAQALRAHAVRNAMIPVLTILGLQAAFLLAGAVIIENVFYLPGLGRLVFQAVTQRDLIVVKGVVMLLVLAVVVIMVVVDLAYAAIDPRIRQGERP